MAEQDEVAVEIPATQTDTGFHFHITRQRVDDDMTVGMQVAIEDLADGIYHPRDWRDLLALFLTDADGQYLPDADAKRAVNALKGAQLKQASADFAKAFTEFSLPKANAAG